MVKEQMLEIFTRVKNHLLDQGSKSQDSDMCLYRDGSRSCAIGCLITDEVYSEFIMPGEGDDEPWNTLEGTGIDGVSVREVVERSLNVGELPDPVWRMLHDLQDIHDGQDVERWPESLDNLEEMVKELEL